MPILRNFRDLIYSFTGEKGGLARDVIMKYKQRRLPEERLISAQNVRHNDGVGKACRETTSIKSVMKIRKSTPLRARYFTFLLYPRPSSLFTPIHEINRILPVFLVRRSGFMTKVSAIDSSGRRDSEREQEALIGNCCSSLPSVSE